jgi:membrane-anchored protein YejM (alkaline phosphatase superfamily)
VSAAESDVVAYLRQRDAKRRRLIAIASAVVLVVTIVVWTAWNFQHKRSQEQRDHDRRVCELVVAMGGRNREC